jgi:hypothetical protein
MTVRLFVEVGRSASYCRCEKLANARERSMLGERPPALGMARQFVPARGEIEPPHDDFAVIRAHRAGQALLGPLPITRFLPVGLVGRMQGQGGWTHVELHNSFPQSAGLKEPQCE